MQGIHRASRWLFAALVGVRVLAPNGSTFTAVAVKL